MNEREFKERTKQVAVRVIHLVESLPKTATADVVGKQLLRSATSIGANYRAACRGKSPADVISKLGIVEEEADETIYWMELLIECGLVSESKLANLMSETNEIVAMIVASIKTLRRNRQQSKI
jgi:four helix bundle protein